MFFSEKLLRRGRVLLLLVVLIGFASNTIHAQGRRTVYCMGETVLDILFRGSTPLSANAGGSALNSSVSLGRAGVSTSFIGEVGTDSTGTHIMDFLKANGVGTECLRRCEGMRTTVSLAYLNDKNDARYVFFMDSPNDRRSTAVPHFRKDDVLLLGSFYAVNPSNRERVVQVLSEARRQGAIVYYDVNLRSPHASMLLQLRPFILELIRQASVVRASRGDLRMVFGSENADSIYNKVVAPLCPRFICTRGADTVSIFTPQGRFNFPVKPIKPVSTIGAGDNYNAGFIFGLLHENITQEHLVKGLGSKEWSRLEDAAQRFSQDCCMHLGNYISEALGQQLRQTRP